MAIFNIRYTTNGVNVYNYGNEKAARQDEHFTRVHTCIIKILLLYLF